MRWTGGVLVLFCCLGVLVEVVLSTGQGDGVPVYGLEASQKVTDDFLVVLRRPSSSSEQERQAHNSACLHRFITHAKANAARIVRNITIADNLIIVRLKLPENLLHKLRNHADVRFIEANRQIRLSDSSYQDSLGKCTEQSTGEALWGLARISSQSLPDFSTATYKYLEGDGKGVEVYVMDTGVYVEHSEFGGRARMGYAASSYQTTDGSTVTDGHGHGTHVSATIAGSTYGVAKGANIVGVKVLGDNGIGTVGDLLEGFQWVSEEVTKQKSSLGARFKAVVSMSLGAGGTVNIVDEAVTSLITGSKISFVVAAGNDANDACSASPGRLALAVTVGATTNTDALASFSSFGPCVDILAPGVNIKSAYIGSTTATQIMSGTSMATPHVTGVVARILSQQCEAISPERVKAWLQENATRGVVDLSSAGATPNYLLHMDCYAEATLISTNRMFDFFNQRDDNDDETRFYVIIGVLVAILVLLVVTMAAACGAKSAVKELQGDSERWRLQMAASSNRCDGSAPPLYQNYGYTSQPPYNPDSQRLLYQQT